VIHYLVQNVVE